MSAGLSNWGSIGKAVNGVVDNVVDKFNDTKQTFKNGTSVETPAQQAPTQQATAQQSQIPQASLHPEGGTGFVPITQEENKANANLISIANSRLNGKGVAQISAKEQEETDRIMARAQGEQIRYEPDFLKTEIGAKQGQINSEQSNLASQIVEQEMQRQGVAMEAVENEVKATRLAEQYYFGDSSGTVSNQGLLDGLKLGGVKFLHGIRADNRIKLNDLRIKAEQLRITAKKEYVEHLDNYIAAETTKNLNDLSYLLSSGGLEYLSDADAYSLAKEAGVSEIEILGMKQQLLMERQAKGFVSDATMRSIETKLNANNPAVNQKFDYSKSTIGGYIDGNGVYRFANPNPSRTQCGQYVNDALGFEQGNPRRIGNTWQDKFSQVYSATPIAGGFFVSGSRNLKKNPYGHVGIVEETGVDDKGAYIITAESNYNGSSTNTGGLFRRRKLYQNGSNPRMYKTKDGKSVIIDGFGEGKPKVESTAPSVAVSKHNSEVMSSIVIPDYSKDAFDNSLQNFKLKVGNKDIGVDINTVAANAAVNGNLYSGMLQAFADKYDVPMPKVTGDEGYKEMKAKLDLVTSAQNAAKNPVDTALVLGLVGANGVIQRAGYTAAGGSNAYSNVGIINKALSSGSDSNGGQAILSKRTTYLKQFLVSTGTEQENIASLKAAGASKDEVAKMVTLWRNMNTGAINKQVSQIDAAQQKKVPATYKQFLDQVGKGVYKSEAAVIQMGAAMGLTQDEIDNAVSTLVQEQTLFGKSKSSSSGNQNVNTPKKP